MVQIAKYTIDLYDVIRDNDFEIFDFNYDFYCDNNVVRNNFEKKFKQKYMFYEIGCETVQRWKLMLKNRLDIIMPKYCELYRSVKRAEEIDFMLNKDYEEIVTRELFQDINQNSNGVNDIIENSLGGYTDLSKESNINNGLSQVNLNDLTGISETKNTTNNNNNTNAKSTQNTKNENSTKETIKNSGKGNIGVTSAGALLEDWRKTIINIDEMLIEDCYDLFINIY